MLLDGQRIHSLPTKEVATRLGILPQTPVAPEGITVADLVVARPAPAPDAGCASGRTDDESIVVEAMRVTGDLDLAERPVDELSGGQRQRAWIAMALAQDTDLMLLDEPTTYLDLAHQIDVLDLLVDLNREHGRTIVLVLHDLNQAARYSDHLVAMKAGAVVATGRPAEVITEELVADVFGLPCRVVVDEVSGTPLVLPIGRHCHTRVVRRGRAARRLRRAPRVPRGPRPITRRARLRFATLSLGRCAPSLAASDRVSSSLAWRRTAVGRVSQPARSPVAPTASPRGS